MKFKPGQQVVCVKKQSWLKGGRIPHNRGPRFNEVLKIQDVMLRPHSRYGMYLFLSFREHHPDEITNGWYSSEWFEPLITNDELQKELETFEQFV